MLAAEEPAPTARYYVPINLLIDLGLRALAPAIPDRIPAGSYGDQMPTIAFGTHPETGALFIQGDLNAGGTGARPAFDGESGMIIFGGLHRAEQPGGGRGVAHRRRCASSATGSGQTRAAPDAMRGGLGIERVYEFLAPAFITFSLERKVTPPWGLWGGRDGAVNGVEITAPDGAVRHVRKATQHPIAGGERVRIMTGGGGGYGPPSERDPEAVAPRRRRGLRVGGGRAARLRPRPRRRALTPSAPGADLTTAR